jgi:hypothetical protein
VTDLELSHSGLRAAVIIAGREIRRLNLGRCDNPVLIRMREVVRDARQVVAQERRQARFRFKLTVNSSRRSTTETELHPGEKHEP